MCYSYFFGQSQTSQNQIAYYNDKDTYKSMYRFERRFEEPSFDPYEFALVFYFNYDANIYKIRRPTILVNLNENIYRPNLLTSMFRLDTIVNATSYSLLSTLEGGVPKYVFKWDPINQKTTDITTAELTEIVTFPYTLVTNNSKLYLSSFDVFKDNINYATVGLNNLKTEISNEITNIFNQKLFFKIIYSNTIGFKALFINSAKDFPNVTSEIDSSLKNNFTFEKARYYNYILIIIYNSDNGSVIYAEIIPNYFQNIYPNPIYTVEDTFKAVGSREFDMVVNKSNFMNCFWFHFNYAALTVTDFTVKLAFEYRYRSTSSISPDSSLKFLFYYSGKLTKNILEWAKLVYSKTPTAITFSLDRWNFICINQEYTNAVSSKQINFSLFYDIGDKQITHSTNILNEEFTYADGGTSGVGLDYDKFSLYLANFKNDFVRLSNFNLISYETTTTKHEYIQTLYFNFRYLNVPLQSFGSNVFFTKFDDYSSSVMKDITIIKDGFNKNFIALKTKFFIQNIFFSGYPKFIINYGAGVNIFDIITKFDGEVLAKLILNGISDMKLKIICNGPYSTKEYNLIVNPYVLTEEIISKISSDFSEITMTITYDVYSIDFYFNISTEISNRRKIDMNNLQDFGQDNMMIMSYSDPELINNLSTNTNKYINKNYYFYISPYDVVDPLECISNFNIFPDTEIESDYITKVGSNLVIAAITSKIDPYNSNSISTGVMANFSDSLKFFFISYSKTNTENILYETPYYYPFLYAANFSITKYNKSVKSYSINELNFHENLNVYLNTNILSLSTISSNLYLFVKTTNPSVNINNYIKFELTTLPEGNTSLITFNYTLHNTYNNISSYKLIFTSKDADPVPYFVRAFVSRSFNQYHLNVNILIENLNFNQYIYKSGGNYIHGIYFKNVLYPLRFAYANDASLNMIRYSLVNSSFTQRLVHENLIELNHSTTNPIGANIELKFDDNISTILIAANFPRFSSKVDNILSCDAPDVDNGLIMLKTNLRTFDKSNFDKLTKISLFENEFTIFTNPTCNCKTVKLLTDAQSTTTNQYNQFVYLKLTPSTSHNRLVYMLSECLGSINFERSWYFETFSFGNTFVGKNINYTDLYYYAPLSTTPFIILPIKYEVTNEILLRNTFNQQDICKIIIQKPLDSSISFNDNIYFNDCFTLAIKPRTAFLAEQSLKFIYSIYGLKYLKVINFLYNTKPQFAFSIWPLEGMAENDDFSINIKTQNIYAKENKLVCKYSFCYLFDTAANYCTSRSGREKIMEIIVDFTESANLSIEFKVSSKMLKDKNVKSGRMDVDCRLCDYYSCFDYKYSGVTINDGTVTPVDPVPTPSPVDPTPTPTPSPIDPTPTPSPIDPTPTPSPIDPTPTPSPIDPTPTPSPVDPTPTPSPIDPTPSPIDPSPITPQPPNSPKKDILKPSIIMDPTKNNTQTLLDFQNSNDISKLEILDQLFQNITEPVISIHTFEDYSEDVLNQIILINDMIQNVNCTIFPDSQACINKNKKIESIVVDKLTDVLNCSKLFDNLFGSSSPSKQLILSALSLYHTTSNFEMFSNSTMFKLADITYCLLKEAPKVIESLKENSQNQTEVNISKIDFINAISYVSSNMIEMAKVNNKGTNDVSTSGNKTITANHSLVITENNLKVKDIVDANVLQFMKMSGELNILETSNLMFIKSKITHEDVQKISTRILFAHSRELTVNNTEEQIIDIEKNNVTIKVFLPIEALKNSSYGNISNLGAVLYNKYPLLSSSNTNFSENVFSLKMFDENFNNVEVKDLTEPIKLMIKKPDPSFKHCVFYEPVNKTWHTQNCKSTDLKDYMLCECNHLTDFTLSKYDPIEIILGVIDVFAEARIMNDWELFYNLNWTNAPVLDIFAVILLLYLFGLIFTIRYDVRSEEDAFIMESDKNDEDCCSQEEAIDTIVELKHVTDKAVEKKKQALVKKLFYKVSEKPNDKDNQIFLKVLKGNLGINANLKENINDNKNECSINSSKTLKKSNFKGLFRNQSKDGAIELENLEDKKDEIKLDLGTSTNNNSLASNHVSSKIKLDDKTEITFSEFLNVLMKACQTSDKLKENILKTFKLKVAFKDNNSSKEGLNTERNEKSFNNSSKISLTHSTVNNSFDLGLIDTNLPQKSNTAFEDKEWNILVKEEINVKHEWFHRGITVVKFFFSTEYRPLVLVIPQECSMSKTNILSLIFIRLCCALSICALLSKSNTKSDCGEECYANRDMSVAIGTILIIEFPFIFIENVLTKIKVSDTATAGKRKTERTRAIAQHIIVYIVFLALFVLGTMNTTWVFLMAEKNNKEIDFIDDFIKSTLFDYLVYEIFIITTKSLIYFSIIKTEEISWWKKCLIWFIATLPWV